MSTEIAVLRALLLLARSRSRARTPVTLADVAARVRDDLAAVQHALASLAAADLVQRSGESIGLTLSGLAVAVAAAARVKAKARRAKTLTSTPRAARTARVIPIVRRRRVAA